MSPNRHFKRLISLLITFCTLLSIIPTSAAAAENQWTVSADTCIHWCKTADSLNTDAALETQVQLFSQELQAKGITTSVLPVNYGTQDQAGANDIILILDSTHGLPAQGYQVVVSDTVTVKASDADGLFYGCRYVLQHLITKDGLTIGYTYADEPLVLERGISLDCGRKYFTKDWILYLIREMSWYNMNALTLHFSEDMGIRLEHPNSEYSWLMGSDNSLSSQNGKSHTYAKDNTIVTETYQCNDADEGKYLTIAELKEIVAYADLYHVEIIPSFDSPGHMTYAIEKYKEKYGVDIGAWIYSNGEKSQPTDNDPAGTSYSIDLSNETAINFARDVIRGYAELFRELGCTKFDMGGDELLGSNARWKESYLPTWAEYARNQTGNSSATPYDAFMLYINGLADMLLDELGYESVRIWNDQAYLDNYASWTVPLDTRIEINFWKKNTNYASATDYNTVYKYLDDGRNVYNYYNDFNYYVVKPNGTYPMMSWDNIYNYWSPYVFETAYTQTTTGYTYDSNTIVVTDEAKKQQVKGSAFCIWCDCPDFKTQDEVIAETINSIRAHAVKAWGEDTIDSTAFATKTGNLGLSPGASGSYGLYPLKTAPTVTVLTDFSALQAAVSESIDSTKYTAASYAAYQDAVDAGNKVLANEAATQEEVDAAVNAINNAKNALTEKPVTDKAELRQEINNAVSSSDYTSGSYAEYSAALSAGETILDNDEATQEEVDAALAAIQKAKAALVLKSDMTKLQAAVNEASNVTESAYTAESYAAYAAAVEEGRVMLENPNASQEQVDTAVSNINAAYAALERKQPVNTAALQAAIGAYSSVDGTLYTPASYGAYTNAVTAGRNVLNDADATQTEVDAAAKAITDAKSALTLRADTYALQKAVDSYHTDYQAYYTTESFDAYTAAVEAGKTVLENEDATQAQVDAARAAIVAAVGNLQSVDGQCNLLYTVFRTGRVRSGGTAVLKVVTTMETNSFTLTDGNGNAIDYDLIRLPNEVCPDGKCAYLKFTVSGSGEHTYTVSVTESSGTVREKSAVLDQWLEA